MKNETTVTTKQFICMMIQFQLGIGILSLPYMTASVAGGDAWISTALTGVCVTGAILIIGMLCKRYPSYTVFEFLEFILGKVFGRIITILYVIYFFSVGVLILISYSHVVKTWLLPNTPLWFTIALMVWISFYLVKENLRIIGRFFVCVTVLLIILFFLVTFTLKDANFLYILPIGHMGWSAILKGSKEAFLSFAGFEGFLIIYPYIQGTPTKKVKAALIGNTCITLFYMYIVCVTSVYFSPLELKKIPEPVLYLVKTLSLHVIARIDLIFLSIWIVSAMTSIVIYMYVVSTGIATLFFQKHHSKPLPFIAILFFIATLILYPNVSTLQNYVANSAIFLILCLPVVLLFLSYARKKKEFGTKSS
ncbi:hypothetical protein COC69_02040 [Bacillus cereus]|uniref:Uncharacterized protein n=1 Tax=Bacillus cereus TaxID=1396 RepID=A0A9X7CSM3_BACCE|nr:GerAB/ArcD/ProY family transporter [Bacillus cereus]PGS83529.1 hypothetical protein COC69_02040 [Bacillus cereus]